MGSSEQAAIWWSMAQKARLAACDLHDGALRLQMLMIAARYEAIARRTAAMADDHARKKQPEAA